MCPTPPVLHLQITVLSLDLSSLESVRTFAAAFKELHKGLNILICNAGV